MAEALPPAHQPPVYSGLANDPDFREVLEAFCRELVAQGRTMQSLLDQQDWPQLQVLAHRLKGSAGGYGFPELSTCALRLEAACEERQPAPIAAALAATRAYIARVTFEPEAPL